mmetsp:Transcript_46843/g.41918  ORF Transcript_46843/g.41918 Transcript_46843/m.41918 type:complete len:174 (-) Transcript_46843:216-737(-)
MGIIRKFIKNLIPTRNYQSFETQKIKTSKFTVIRRKRKTSSIGKVLRSISFLVAALCIFEAAVWFSTGFPEPENNKLRIFYLETRISLHQPTTVENPFEIIQSQISYQSALIALLLISTRFKFDQNKYLTDKYNQETETSNKPNSIEQANTDYVVLQFLTLLASPKKLDRWIQ